MDFGSILTVVVFVLVIFGALRGASNVGRQVVRTGLTACATLLAFLTTIATKDLIIDSVTPEKIKEILLSVGEQAELVNLAELANYLTTLDLVAALISALCAPIVFASAFLVFYGASNVVASAITKILGIGASNPSGVMAVGGIALGAVEGITVALTLCLPISGLLGLADDSVNLMRENDNEMFSYVVTTYDESFASLNDHFAIVAADNLGADEMMDEITTVNIHGSEIHLRDEFVNVVSVIVEFSSIGKVNFVELSEENKASITSAVNALENSNYLMMLASGIVSDIGRALEDGVVPVAVPAPYDVVLYPSISMLATSNVNNFKADIDTVLEIYYLLSDCGALKAFGSQGQEEELTNALITVDAEGKTVINKIIEIIEKNEHMSSLIKAITDMSLVMLTNQLGIDADIVEIYEDLKTGVNEVLAVNPDDYATNEEYVEARNEKLDEVFTNNGIELEPDMINGIGDFIDENFSDLEQISDDDINDIILSYYDVYVDLQSQGNIIP